MFGTTGPRAASLINVTDKMTSCVETESITDFPVVYSLFGRFDIRNRILRPDFTSRLVLELAFGTPKFYIARYEKKKHRLINLSYN